MDYQGSLLETPFTDLFSEYIRIMCTVYWWIKRTTQHIYKTITLTNEHIHKILYPNCKLSFKSYLEDIKSYLYFRMASSQK